LIFLILYIIKKEHNNLTQEEITSLVKETVKETIKNPKKQEASLIMKIFGTIGVGTIVMLVLFALTSFINIKIDKGIKNSDFAEKLDNITEKVDKIPDINRNINSLIYIMTGDSVMNTKIKAFKENKIIN